MAYLYRRTQIRWNNVSGSRNGVSFFLIAIELVTVANNLAFLDVLNVTSVNTLEWRSK
jgi:hypothetical protein